MRTIIPFPALHVVEPASRGKNRPVRRCPPPTSDEAREPVVEGEEFVSEWDELPRARTVHASIVHLIHAVHGRFG